MSDQPKPMIEDSAEVTAMKLHHITRDHEAETISEATPPDQPKPTTGKGKAYGYNCAVCSEPLYDNEYIVHTDNGVAHHVCTQPKPTVEWTVERLKRYTANISDTTCQGLADDINAALVTEAVKSIESMTRVQQQVNDQANEIQQLKEQLATAQMALGRAVDATGISFDPNPLPGGRTK